MDERGSLENMNLSGIEFSKDGRSVTLFLVDTISPFTNSNIEFHNVYSFILHRGLEDEFPYYVGDLVWKELDKEEKQIALEKAKYPVSNENGVFSIIESKIISAHIEGGVCGHILAEKVVFIETPNTKDGLYRCRVNESGNPIDPDAPGEFVTPFPGF